MENIDVKTMISERLGIPIDLLRGESAEEDIATAKALIAYKRQHEQTREKSNAEKFADWFRAQEGIEQPDEIGAAFTELEEAIRVNSNAYPHLTDGGEAHLGDTRSAKEKFAEWIGQKTAFDPFKSDDGWTRLI